MSDGVPGSLMALERAPQAFLIRPNGAFLADSQHPFSFGNATEQPLADCWQGLRDSWRSERVETWRRGARNPGQAPKRELVPYRDEEVTVAGRAPGRAATRKGGTELESALELLATKAPDFPADGTGDVSAASDRVRELALRRRYRLAPIRWSGSSGGRRLVRVIAGGEVRALNASAGLAMDALDDGCADDAASALMRANPGLDRAGAQRDAFSATVALVEAGIAVPALSRGDDVPSAPGEGSLSGLPD